MRGRVRAPEKMKSVTRKKPEVWGDSIVGFGSYHYEYATAEGDMLKTGFAARGKARPESVYRILDEINAFVDFRMSRSTHSMRRRCVPRKPMGSTIRREAIQAGLEADLPVFDRDPLEQPSVLQNPLLVVSNGRVGVNRTVGTSKILPNHQTKEESHEDQPS